MSTILANRKSETPQQPIVMALKPSMGLFLEQYGPAAIGVAAGLLILKIPAVWLLHATWRDLLLDKMLDIQIGVLAGLLAIVAFLPAIEDKTVIRKFKQWGKYRYLVGYLKEAIWICGLAMLMSIALIIFSDAWKFNIKIEGACSSLWWGLVVYSFATAFRITKLALKSLLAE